MFGMGIGEILLIVVVAVIFLGPEKLPKAIVEVAKTIKAVKKHVNEARDTLDQEINLTEYREEMNSLKKGFEEGTQSMNALEDFSFEDDKKKPSPESKPAETKTTATTSDKKETADA